eukprot:TRINITY_DN13503_c0_g2_i1.p1 TRINITY_DN13503_c0_g2~~TRINITY_DN13503_c0_g2_i1.p1  ORF type:complete len:537 (-),score=23.26 TRINITY_DN13503_c0_g2_i1:78-1505(-)
MFSMLLLTRHVLWKMIDNYDDLKSFQNTDGILYRFGLPIVLAALFSHIVLRIAALVTDLCLVQSQVQGFSIRDSHCFCCSNNHVHPLTGEELACDRKLVYDTLGAWHDEAQHVAGVKEEAARVSKTESAVSRASRASRGCKLQHTLSRRKSKMAIAEALDSFDEVVRNDLSIIISQVSNRSLIICSYRDCVRCVGVPYVWSGVATGAHYLRRGEYHNGMRWLVEYSTVPLFVFPLACAALVATVMRLEARSCKVSLSPRCVKVLSSTLASVAWFLTFFALWWLGPMLVDDEKALTLWDLLLTARWFGLAALTLHVLRPRRASLEEIHEHDFQTRAEAPRCSRQSSDAGSSHIEVVAVSSTSSSSRGEAADSLDCDDVHLAEGEAEVVTTTLSSSLGKHESAASLPPDRVEALREDAPSAQIPAVPEPTAVAAGSFHAAAPCEEQAQEECCPPVAPAVLGVLQSSREPGSASRIRL